MGGVGRVGGVGGGREVAVCEGGDDDAQAVHRGAEVGPLRADREGAEGGEGPHGELADDGLWVGVGWRRGWVGEGWVGG